MLTKIGLPLPDVLQQVFAQDCFDDGDNCCGRDRSATKGGAELPFFYRVRQLVGRQYCAARDTAGDRFGQCNQVRINAVNLRGKKLPRPAHAALNFVGDQDSATGACCYAQCVNKFG